MVMAAAAMLPAHPAAAQLLDNYVPSALPLFDSQLGTTVQARIRPDYEPPGVRLGGVVVRPNVDESFGYDDNVFSQAKKQGSAFVSTVANLRAVDQGSQDNVQIGLNVNDVRYLSLPAQSFTNWVAGGGWDHDFGQDRLHASYNHLHLNQTTSGIDNVGLLAPLPYDVDDGRVEYQAIYGRVTLTPSFEIAATRFNGTSTSFVVPANNLPARNVETGTLLTEYQLAPQRNIVVQMIGAVAQYLQGSPRQNYNDVSALAGYDDNTDGLFHYRLLVGFEVRSYDNPIFGQHVAPAAEGAVSWTPTGLTTVTAAVRQRLEDSNVGTNIAFNYTNASLTVDHEYLRNVILTGRVGVSRASYLQSSEQQTLYGIGASATWLLDRKLRLSAGYEFVYNAETAPSLYTTRNVTLVQLRLAL